MIKRIGTIFKLTSKVKTQDWSMRWKTRPETKRETQKETTTIHRKKSVSVKKIGTIGGGVVCTGKTEMNLLLRRTSAKKHKRMTWHDMIAKHKQKQWQEFLAINKEKALFLRSQFWKRINRLGVAKRRTRRSSSPCRWKKVFQWKYVTIWYGTQDEHRRPIWIEVFRSTSQDGAKGH